MHKPSLAQIVYNHLFPKPRSNDPSSFANHAARNLVAEVRTETANFYGALDCIEAQYPGLDYSFPPHRKRLSRFHHHRRLFRAFDELGLTEAEISQLCQWEGTKFARERYEKNEGITIRDTTLDTIVVEPPNIPPSVRFHWTPNTNGNRSSLPGGSDEFADDDMETDEEGSDDGIEIDGRGMSDRSARGPPLDMASEDIELFEQWLKETIERGGHADVVEAVRQGRPIQYSYHFPPAHTRVPASSTAVASSQMAASQAAMGQGATQMSGTTLTSANVPMTTLTEHPVGSPHNPTRRPAR